MLQSFLSNNRCHVRIENDREDFGDYLGMQHSHSSDKQSLGHFSTGKTRTDDRDLLRLRLFEIIRETLHIVHSSNRKYSGEVGARDDKGGSMGTGSEDETVVQEFSHATIRRV